MIDQTTVDRFHTLLAEKKRVEAELEPITEELKAIEAKLIADCSADGVVKWVGSNGRGVRIERQVFASAGGDMARLCKAFVADRMSEMVTKTVNGSRLSAWAREFDDKSNPRSPEEIKAKMPKHVREAIKVSETFYAKPMGS